MPITRDEFNDRRRNPATSLLSFLREHGGLAFTVDELMFELGGLGLILTVEEVSKALVELQARSRIEAAEVEGTLYYVYRSSLGFRPPER
jgi:hypothetical protein